MRLALGLANPNPNPKQVRTAFLMERVKANEAEVMKQVPS